MSSRALRKLRACDKEIDLNRFDTNNEQKTDDACDFQAVPSSEELFHTNSFDLLNNESLSENEEELNANTSDGEKPLADCEKIQDKTQSKKKRRRRRRNNAPHVKEIESVHNCLDMKSSNAVDFLPGKSVEKSMPFPSADVGSQIAPHMLLIRAEMKHLNPNNEIRRTFGQCVQRHKRGRQKASFLRTTMLVDKKSGWPEVTKNLITMKITLPLDVASNSTSTNTNTSTITSINTSVNTSASTSTSSSTINTTTSGSMGNEQWFSFVHNQYYQDIQSVFMYAVERLNSDLIVALLKECPYHVDSLVQLSELCRMTENYVLATDTLERALYIMESSLHPSFNLLTGRCHLDYRVQENRSFFIVLLKRAQYLDSRACSRTALEVAKLLLSLNPAKDPLAMVLVIDYYAIRSNQTAWLIDFYEQWDPIKNLSQLPNMAWSYALALYCENGKTEKSDAALQYALLMFPGVLRLLLSELSVEIDKRLANASYFDTEISNSQSPALHQLVTLYICRAKVIWKHKNMLPWLQENVNAILDIVEHDSVVVKEYNQKRSARYLTPPRAILRHVILSDYRNVPLSSFLIKETEQILMYDPLPPLNSINLYDRRTAESRQNKNLNNNSFSIFLQSLLPTFSPQHHFENQNIPAELAEAFIINANNQLMQNAGNVEGGHLANIVEAAQGGDNANVHNGNDNQQQHNDDDNPTAATRTYHGLSRSLFSMMDTLRDLLQNLHVTEPLMDNNPDDNSSGDNDSDH